MTLLTATSAYRWGSRC